MVMRFISMCLRPKRCAMPANIPISIRIYRFVYAVGMCSGTAFLLTNRNSISVKRKRRHNNIIGRTDKNENADRGNARGRTPCVFPACLYALVSMVVTPTELVLYAQENVKALPIQHGLGQSYGVLLYVLRFIMQNAPGLLTINLLLTIMNNVRK